MRVGGAEKIEEEKGGWVRRRRREGEEGREGRKGRKGGLREAKVQ